MSSSYSNKNYFTFEFFESYYGDSHNVKKIMNECKACHSKLIFSHMPDYRNLTVQETARCLDCDANHRKVIHVLN